MHEQRGRRRRRFLTDSHGVLQRRIHPEITAMNHYSTVEFQMGEKFININTFIKVGPQDKIKTKSKQEAVLIITA